MGAYWVDILAISSFVLEWDHVQVFERDRRQSRHPLLLITL
jgi:hypothetical protein